MGWRCLEKEVAPHSSILAWETPGTRSLAGYGPWGRKSRTWLSDWTTTTGMKAEKAWEKGSMRRSQHPKGAPSCMPPDALVSHSPRPPRGGQGDRTLGSVFLLLFFFFKYLFACASLSCSMGTLRCGLWNLVPWPGIKSGLPALGMPRLSHWTTREVPQFSILNSNSLFSDYSLQRASAFLLLEPKTVKFQKGTSCFKKRWNWEEWFHSLPLLLPQITTMEPRIQCLC